MRPTCKGASCNPEILHIGQCGLPCRAPHLTRFDTLLQDLVESVSDMGKANDWFLVAPDFTDYMRAQAGTSTRPTIVTLCRAVQPVCWRCSRCLSVASWAGRQGCGPCAALNPEP